MVCARVCLAPHSSAIGQFSDNLMSSMAHYSLRAQVGKLPPSFTTISLSYYFLLSSVPLTDYSVV